jgi:hypothetical protein
MIRGMTHRMFPPSLESIRREMRKCIAGHTDIQTEIPQCIVRCSLHTSSYSMEMTLFVVTQTITNRKVNIQNQLELCSRMYLQHNSLQNNVNHDNNKDVAL